MDQLPAFGLTVPGQVMQTRQLYMPLLQANKAEIHGPKRETFTFGPHAVHQLDVYTPATTTTTTTAATRRRKVLLFAYGGGMINGSRRIGPDTYANLAAFFARRRGGHGGYTTVIPDYRLISHGARYPSGGEDLALAIDWVRENLGPAAPAGIDLFLVGNSAGGTHLATTLFEPSFAATRAAVLGADSHVRLRAAVLLSAPLSFGHPGFVASESYGAYYGGGEGMEARSPLALMRRALEAGGGQVDFVAGGARLLLLHTELDPEPDCIAPKDEFAREWLRLGDRAARDALATAAIPGHNHISPVLALGTGIEREEAWGVYLDGFFEMASSAA